MKYRFLPARRFPVCLLGLGVAVTLTAFVVSLPASPPAPSWSGQENTTSQRYTFTTGDPMMMAEEFDNDYGSPALEVTVDSDTAPGFGTGWQDPGEEESVTRSDSGGAWDLGPQGDIEVTFPFADEGGLSDGETYNVEFLVNIVYANEPFYSVPDLSIDSHTPETDSVHVDGGFDAEFPGWSLTAWEGGLSGIETNSLSFVANATGESGSLVDTYEIYTQYTVIPEPATYAGIVGGVVAVALVCRRRRRSRGIRGT